MVGVWPPPHGQRPWHTANSPGGRFASG